MVLFMQIGMSEKSVLRDFHPDAEDLYNVTMDLSTVCRELKDRNKRMPRRVWHIFVCPALVYKGASVHHLLGLT